ncbi:hypothetical protein HHI36_007078 [Cryptolaemus montrouzieri]|uniref:Uncharacterized protein n=1 Tax=Cryptolaemus montrouzieri TaxID=559131 RepID=A0ABD2MPD0_9CUCU
MKKNGEDFGGLQFNATKIETTNDNKKLVDKTVKPVIVPKKDAVKCNVPETVVATQTKSARTEPQEKPAGPVLKNSKIPTANSKALTKNINPQQAQVSARNILPGTKSINASVPCNSAKIVKGDSDIPKEYSVSAQRNKHHHHHHHPQTIIEDEDDTSEDSSEKLANNQNIEQHIQSALEQLAHSHKNNRVSATVEYHTQSDKSNRSSNAPSLNDFPITNKNKIRRVATGIDLPSHMSSRASSPNFRRENSVRSLRNGYYGDKLGSEYGESNFAKPFSDMGSIRSWASVGLGSTDGKKMIIRRVPTSPEELFTIVNPPT